jgi:hypothetical protein
VFLAQVVGFTIYFNHEKAKIRKEIKSLYKEGVTENQLIKFKFSPRKYAKLVFVKKNEFKLKNNYFDIIDLKIDLKGNYIVKCINDVQETILFKNLTQNVHFNLGNESNHSPLKIVFSVVEKPFINNSKELNFKLFSDCTKQNTNFCYIGLKSSKHINIFTPPPTSFL